MFPYERVIIVGNSGAGKSTLARQMGERFGLPVVHLDKLFWLPDWVERDLDEFDKLLTAELKKPRWIIDGNYFRTIDMRLSYADAAIMLDFPTEECWRNAQKRGEMYRGKTRPDMTDGCIERIDDSFREWIFGFNSTQRDKTLSRLQQSGKPYFVFGSRSDVAEWLDSFDK